MNVLIYVVFCFVSVCFVLFFVLLVYIFVLFSCFVFYFFCAYDFCGRDVCFIVGGVGGMCVCFVLFVKFLLFLWRVCEGDLVIIKKNICILFCFVLFVDSGIDEGPYNYSIPSQFNTRRSHGNKEKKTPKLLSCMPDNNFVLVRSQRSLETLPFNSGK